jgi:hypothetical protein
MPSLDGPTLLASLDSQRHLTSVEYEDESKLTCVIPTCSGIVLSALGSEGALRLALRRYDAAGRNGPGPHDHAERHIGRAFAPKRTSNVRCQYGKQLAT